MKFYKLSLNSNSNRATYKECFGCLRTDLCTVWWFVFMSSWPPLLWGAITLSFLIHFLQLLVCQMRQEEGVQVLFGHQKRRSPPLGSGLPWALKCSVTSWSTVVQVIHHHWNLISLVLYQGPQYDNLFILVNCNIFNMCCGGCTFFLNKRGFDWTLPLYHPLILSISRQASCTFNILSLEC